ncbi:unnamed protein product [Somion occarium]|uniref:F-box domain-containing protein n=1 Tax=Somion occarium TaxID=3059160 RepID=A0ABP1DLH8_9APHY
MFATVSVFHFLITATAPPSSGTVSLTPMSILNAKLGNLCRQTFPSPCFVLSGKSMEDVQALSHLLHSSTLDDPSITKLPNEVLEQVFLHLETASFMLKIDGHLGSIRGFHYASSVMIDIKSPSTVHISGQKSHISLAAFPPMSVQISSLSSAR